MDNHIPPTLGLRTRLRGDIAKFAAAKRLVPPVALHTLRELAVEFAASCADSDYAASLGEWTDWIMVEIHNAVWMPTVAAIPFDRRLLLLPKCLSSSRQCEGEVDELGLLCHRCGRCVIPSLQDRAEELGVLSIVAEGFATVIELIENQVVDAVVGVSCLDSLEKAFPLLVSHAVPGLAIPLNRGGCADTDVDLGYIMSILPAHTDDEIELIDYDHIRQTVGQWFTREGMAEHWGGDDTDVCGKIALDWLLADGKRWRPFLLTAVYQALTGNREVTADVQRAALAVECFHKASLVHDDIQDCDTERNGKPTLHVLHGEAMAINIGDLLLGKGYQLLSRCGHRELVAAIAEAHLSLCQGQGNELAWSASPTALTRDMVIDIFRKKTVPAFSVALLLGLICADCGGSATMREALERYSESLGIAYQLNDDIDDIDTDTEEHRRPTMAFALKAEHPDWSKERVREEMRRMTEQYHVQALNALGKIESLELKRLLFQVTEKILKTK